MKFKVLLLISVLFSLLSKQINAGGTDYLPVFGARTLALNGMYIASNSGLSSSFINPASLTFLNGKGIELAFVDRLEQQVFDSRNHGLYNSFRDNNTGFGGGLFWKIKDGFAAALSYNRVTDYNVNWPFAIVRKTDSLSALLAFDMKNSIEIDAISPAAAFNLGPVALGFSVNIYRVNNSVSLPLGNPLWYSKGHGSAAYQLSLDQSAWSFGATLGALTHLSDNLQLGAFIRSGYKANLKGNASSSMFSSIDSVSSQTDINSNLEMPWTLGLGLVHKISNNLVMNVDVIYSMWGSTQKNMLLNFNSQLWQNRLSSVDSLTGINPGNFNLSYKNTIDAGFGIEYTSESGMQYRCGYRFSQSPNSEDTFNFLFPGVDQHWISAGFGYTDENLTFDAAIAYSFGFNKEINRSGTYSNISGKYSSDNYVPTINIQYRF